MINEYSDEFKGNFGNSPCPAVSRDNEVSDVESSEDGTSDEERKKREETLSEDDRKSIFESIKKLKQINKWINGNAACKTNE